MLYRESVVIHGQKKEIKFNPARSRGNYLSIIRNKLNVLYR